MPLPRFDGTLCTDVPAYRRIVPFLMRGRNESAVYFEQTIDLTRTLPFIAEWNASHPREQRITFFHVLLGALPRLLAERPRLNRFVSGERIYQRNGVHVSFAAKKKMDDEAPLQVVKLRFEASEPFGDMVRRVVTGIGDAKSDKITQVDKELDLFLRLPRFLLSFAVRVLGLLDFYNLAPRMLLEPDPMYTSVFLANLGSLKMGGGFHHLYEYGNCPIFGVVGQIETVPVVVDETRIEPRTVCKVRWSYDERIEDGLYCARSLQLLKQLVEDPASWAR